MAKLVDVGSIGPYFESLSDPGTRVTANTSWPISPSSPSAASSAAATAPPPSIAGASIASRGWPGTSPCPAASLRATASAASSWC
ncbi:MAG: hypothetical protein JWN86_222 [Planctomycetota bacterium]|nr:hypothetical protein [Planctomycetota bacterium]